MERPRKIAFVGTSCVGKTTLLEACKKKFSSDPTVAFIEEAARAFFSANPDVSDRFSEKTQEKVQALALENEVKAQNGATRLIFCDRSVIDAVAYVRSQGNLEGSQNLLNKVLFWLPTYDALLLLDPHDVPYRTDDIRQENEETRQQFHNAFIEVFEGAKIPYTLLSGTIEERLQTIQDVVGS